MRQRRGMRRCSVFQANVFIGKKYHTEIMILYQAVLYINSPTRRDSPPGSPSLTKMPTPSHPASDSLITRSAGATPSFVSPSLPLRPPRQPSSPTGRWPSGYVKLLMRSGGLIEGMEPLTCCEGDECVGNGGGSEVNKYV